MIGRRLSHDTVMESFGSGGMGVVYRARNQHLEREVKLKVLPAGALADGESRRRFRVPSPDSARVLRRAGRIAEAEKIEATLKADGTK